MLLLAVAIQPSAALAVTWGPGVEASLPNAAANPAVAIWSVSCPAVGDCSAVGDYNDSSNNAQGLLLSERGGKWAPGVAATLPSAASNPGVTLWSVSCPAVGDCAAVGQYYDSLGAQQGLLLTETAGTWAAGVQAGLPANAAASQIATIQSVSCPSVGNCGAVGYYTDNTGKRQGLLLTETGGIWGTGVEAMLPAGASFSPPPSLNSVSCASAGNCTAVGTYYDTGGHRQGVLLTETGGIWGAGVEASLPGFTAPDPFVALASVSCPTAGACSAVGSYVDISGGQQGLLLTETGGTWTAVSEAAPPLNAGVNPLVQLGSVSCAAAGTCTAVGLYTVGTTTGEGLLLSETAGTWAPGLEATIPSNAASSPGVVLSSVSCPSVGNCGAVGYYTDSSGANFQGLLLTETGGTWAPGAEATLPANAATSNEGAKPLSVSCPAAGGCSAVGHYTDASNHTQGLLLGTQATPALSVSAPSSETAGSPITATSALSGGLSPTGTITFKVFGPQASPPSSCVAGGTAVGTAAVAGNGTYHPAAPFTPTSPGDYWWYASYGGDSNNTAAASPCGMAETVVGPVVLSRLAISPRTFVVSGRRLGGHCVKATRRNHRHRRCTRPIKLTISYRLNSVAMVVITFVRELPGRVAGGHCVKQTRRNRRHRSCERLVPVPGSLTQSGTPGANGLTFDGRLRGQGLAPGSYLLTATPSVAGQAGKAQTIAFAISV